MHIHKLSFATSLPRSLALVLIILGVATPAMASEDATLTAVKGKVWVTSEGGQPALAQTGNVISAGSRVRTEAASQATLTFKDGSLLEVHPKTELRLSKNSRRRKPKKSILLVVGRIWNKVARSVGGEHFEVNTPNAVCGVRGTEFETVVADDGGVMVRVTEGAVQVDGEENDGNNTQLGAGQRIEGDEAGLRPAEKQADEPDYDAWRKKRRERLRKEGREIIKGIKARIMSRKGKIEALLERQKQVEARRKQAESRARQGDKAALDEVRAYNEQLAELADAIADLGDEATAQFGIVDHFADLAKDRRFRMIGGKHIAAEAASLRRIQANLDKLVADGTDISIESMDQLLKDMGSGKRGGLREKGGSAADDLFGSDPMEMR